ncbi:protein-tyrosine phosphatase family protein [Photobacterium satsumensis]|uniref:protein-tyrosine phosphatase family protein n=1 Tax=Photobacterium satsumensis TaxID=2910239 RepID=UPI003D0CDAF4
MQGERELMQTKSMNLMGIKGGAKRVIFNPDRDRFNIPHSAQTRINDGLNANFIIVNSKFVAIAMQYPIYFQLETFFQTLVINRTPILVVLASHADMRNDNLPDYFSRSDRYGGINVNSSRLEEVVLSPNVDASVFNLNVSGYQATIDIPVVHVWNWPDHKTISLEATLNLVELIESIAFERKEFYKKRNSRAFHEVDKLLPVIHCRAGVGRTGQTIAAMVMNRPNTLSLPDIIKDLRVSRNDLMVQTVHQMKTLVEMEEYLKSRDVSEGTSC